MLIKNSSDLLSTYKERKKEKKSISKKDREASRANTQPFSEYYSAIRTYSVIRVYMFSSYNIIRVVKYGYDEYNTINFEYE